MKPRVFVRRYAELMKEARDEEPSGYPPFFNAERVAIERTNQMLNGGPIVVEQGLRMLCRELGVGTLNIRAWMRSNLELTTNAR